MHIKDYLKNKQPFVYQTFLNAINNDQLSHAYLLVGENGTPLKETALFLAKSLLCDSPDPLACENCITCIRVDNNQYADIIIEDGSESNIKKEDIDHIISTFSRTSIESKGKVIYIIHLVETLKPVVINALLKFLEEPGKNTYAFLTTQNEARVLPTIISRSQRLVLRLTPRNEVIEEAKKLDTPIDDIELLSYFYNDPETIKNMTLDDKYKTTKECLNEFINNMLNKNDLFFVVENKLLSEISDKEHARIFLDMLTSVFEDIIRAQNGENIFLTSYDKIIKELATHLKHVDSSLLELITLRSQLDINVTVASVFEHLAAYITKE